MFTYVNVCFVWQAQKEYCAPTGARAAQLMWRPVAPLSVYSTCFTGNVCEFNLVITKNRDCFLSINRLILEMDVQCVFWGTEMKFLKHCLTEKECKDERKAWKEGERNK